MGKQRKGNRQAITLIGIGLVVITSFFFALGYVSVTSGRTPETKAVAHQARTGNEGTASIPEIKINPETTKNFLVIRKGNKARFLAMGSQIMIRYDGERAYYVDKGGTEVSITEHPIRLDTYRAYLVWSNSEQAAIGGLAK